MNLLSWMTARYRNWTRPRPREDAKVYRIGPGKFGPWGDCIVWVTPGYRVYGFKSPQRPSDGDILLCKMSSGQDGRYVMTNVKRHLDPPDMFFADTVWDGYEEGPRREEIQ